MLAEQEAVDVLDRLPRILRKGLIDAIGPQGVVLAHVYLAFQDPLVTVLDSVTHEPKRIIRFCVQQERRGQRREGRMQLRRHGIAVSKLLEAAARHVRAVDAGFKVANCAVVFEDAHAGVVVPACVDLFGAEAVFGHCRIDSPHEHKCPCVVDPIRGWHGAKVRVEPEILELVGFVGKRGDQGGDDHLGLTAAET